MVRVARCVGLCGGALQSRPTWASAATASATPAACDSPTRPPPPGSGWTYDEPPREPAPSLRER